MHSHHRPQLNGRGHDYTALQVDDNFHHSPTKIMDLHNRCYGYWCVKVKYFFKSIL